MLCILCSITHVSFRNKPAKKYVVDDLAEQYGHKVLRLPPYHCVFNPIELVWGITKNYYNRHMGRDGNTQDACLKMWQEALETVTPEMWKNSIRHTEDIINDWYNREQVMDRDEVLPLIINVDGDSSDSSDFSDS